MKPLSEDRIGELGFEIAEYIYAEILSKVGRQSCYEDKRKLFLILDLFKEEGIDFLIQNRAETTDEKLILEECNDSLIDEIIAHAIDGFKMMYEEGFEKEGKNQC